MPARERSGYKGGIGTFSNDSVIESFDNLRKYFVIDLNNIDKN